MWCVLSLKCINKNDAEIVLIALISYSSVLVNLVITPAKLLHTALFICGKEHRKETESRSQREYSVRLSGCYCSAKVTVSACKGNSFPHKHRTLIFVYFITSCK